MITFQDVNIEMEALHLQFSLQSWQQSLVLWLHCTPFWMFFHRYWSGCRSCHTTCFISLIVFFFFLPFRWCPEAVSSASSGTAPGDQSQIQRIYTNSVSKRKRIRMAGWVAWTTTSNENLNVVLCHLWGSLFHTVYLNMTAFWIS